MQIILLIPVETRLSLEQTDKPNQVCKRPLRIYLHGLCVGPTQTMRSLIQQFAFQLEVLAPEKNNHCAQLQSCSVGTEPQTNLIHPSIHALLSSPARRSRLDLNSQVALYMI